MRSKFTPNAVSYTHLEVEPGVGIEDVLLIATDAGGRGVRLLERPYCVEGIEGPDFRALLAAAALVVSAVADEEFVVRVPDARAFVAKPRRDGRGGERRALDPGVRFLRRERRGFVGAELN